MSQHEIGVLGTFEHPAGDSEKGHPSHEGFAETIGADTIPLRRPPALDNRFVDATVLSELTKCTTLSVPEYDVYVTGHSCTLLLAPMIKLQYPDSIFIYQGSDPYLYGENLYLFEQTTMPSYLKRLDRRVYTYLLRKAVRGYVDGVLAVSEFVADFVRPAVKQGTPISIAHPYIDPSKYELLEGAQPDLGSNAAVFIAAWSPDFKGIDILLEAWRLVRTEYPEATLTIVGNVPAGRYPETEGVDFAGFVELDRFREILEASSLYVHPARCEAFGVSVVEAMHAGIPAVVTNTTGARSVARNVEESMVVEPSPDAIASSVVDYFSLDTSRRRELSDQSRTESTCFDAETKKGQYKQKFESLLRTIEDVS